MGMLWGPKGDENEDGNWISLSDARIVAATSIECDPGYVRLKDGSHPLGGPIRGLK